MEYKMHYDVLVALGAMFEGKGRLSENPLMLSRTNATIKFYNAGWSKNILVSGGPQEVRGLIAAETYIPRERLIVTPEGNEPAPKNTVDNILDITKQLPKFPEPVRDLLVITSDYHVGRVRLSASRLLPNQYEADFIGVPSGLKTKQLGLPILNEIPDTMLTAMLLAWYDSSKATRASQVMDRIYETAKPLLRQRVAASFHRV